jgi:hypothetical protein
MPLNKVITEQKLSLKKRFPRTKAFPEQTLLMIRKKGV